MSEMYDQPGRQAAGGGSTSAPTDPNATAAGQATTAGRLNVPQQTTGYEDLPAGGRAASGAAMGLTVMAAVIMMIAGVLGFFEGLAAVIKGSFLVVLPNYAFSMSATGWGVVHMIIGAVVFLVGAALLTGNKFARFAGVFVAACSAIANFVWLPYQPVWAVVVIALDIFVIWALLTPRNPLGRSA
jgi:hypothetical protein